jgi:hypothetical protein
MRNSENHVNLLLILPENGLRTTIIEKVQLKGLLEGERKTECLVALAGRVRGKSGG